MQHSCRCCLQVPRAFSPFYQSLTRQQGLRPAAQGGTRALDLSDKLHHLNDVTAPLGERRANRPASARPHADAGRAGTDRPCTQGLAAAFCSWEGALALFVSMLPFSTAPHLPRFGLNQGLCLKFKICLNQTE